MVRQWQTMRGYGALGCTARQFDEALELALAAPSTSVIDVHVDADEHCFPRIAPGVAATDMLEWTPDRSVR
jgi:thiamine pyrophosphate-dependent acetolactate synthase large subunit-like protein